MATHILLIEDNPGDAKLIEAHLGVKGDKRFDLTHVVRLGEGLKTLEEKSYDIILLDLNLPDGHGLESYTRLHDAAPLVPIIVLTGLDDEKLALEALQVGAQDYIVKGMVDGKLLSRAIRYAIERKKIEQTEKELAREKDEFLASISHDLKTPLFTVIGFLELLEQGKFKDPTTQKEFLARARDDAERLKAMVDDLLDMSRFEAQRLKLDVEPILVDELVHSSVSAINVLAQAKGVRMDCRSLDSKAEVCGDPQRLRRVLANLLENAIKFSSRNQCVTVSWEIEADRVRIRVADEGPGIPIDEQGKIFEKFYQVEQAPGASAKGTGLGLYISKNFIDAHEGALSVKSTLGRGSTFTVELPLRAARC